MARLPLTAHLKQYWGSKQNLIRKYGQQNETACRIADHVNKLIANNPSEMQQYMFGSIAIALGVTAEQVRSAISDGGHNGITLRVSEEDRLALARYQTADKPS